MPSIDERIKAELERDSERLDAILVDHKGLDTMVWDAFKGSLKGWMWTVASITAVLILLLLYQIFQFATAETVEAMVRYGFWMVLTCIGVVGFELWAWMQINRVATRREVRQMEFALKKLVEETSQR